MHLFRSVLVACVVLGAVSALGAGRGVPADLEHAKPARRLAALEALEHSPDVTALDAVVLRLADSDATIRWQACGTLLAIGDARALPALEKATHDPSPLVATRAVQAWRVLRGQRPDDARPAWQVSALHAQPGATGSLQAEALDAVTGVLGKASGLRRASGPTDATHQLALAVQSVSERDEAALHVVKVTVSLVLSEQPGSRLRFASRAAAESAQSGTVDDKTRRQLAAEAARAAAEALAEEAAGYLVR